MLGAFFAVFVPKGLGGEFGGWLLIHGTTELFAIVLAGAAGFRIGMAVAFPGRLSRIDSAVAAGRGAGGAVGGVRRIALVAGPRGGRWEGRRGGYGGGRKGRVRGSGD